jgi:hypothetical protein
MVVTQNIPPTRITGPQTFVFTNTPPGANDAIVTIDRMVTPGGLDTLAPGTSLVIGIERSYDGGTTWEPPISITCQGGHIVTVKNGVSVTRMNETLGVTQLKLHAAASDPVAGCWTFTVTANGSGTVTVPITTTVTGNNTALTVWVHRGGTAATVARSALGTGTSRTLSYTASQADSAIVWAVADWAAAAVQTPTPASTAHTAASPGPTAVPASGTVASAYTWNSAVLDDQTSVAATSYGIGGTGTGPFVILVVEIQGSGAAVARPQRTRLAPMRQAVNRAATY